MLSLRVISWQIDRTPYTCSSSGVRPARLGTEPRPPPAKTRPCGCGKPNATSKTSNQWTRLKESTEGIARAHPRRRTRGGAHLRGCLCKQARCVETSRIGVGKRLQQAISAMRTLSCTPLRCTETCEKGGGGGESSNGGRPPALPPLPCPALGNGKPPNLSARNRAGRAPRAAAGPGGGAGQGQRHAGYDAWPARPKGPPRRPAGLPIHRFVFPLFID